MIVLEDLNPILEPLLEGREDAAEIIESVISTLVVVPSCH